MISFLKLQNNRINMGFPSAMFGFVLKNTTLQFPLLNFLDYDVNIEV